LSDPYRNVIGIFLNRLLNNKHFYIYGDGEQKRAFSYIEDVTPAMIKSATTQNCEGKIINIGGEEDVTLNQLSDLVLKHWFDSNNIPEEFKPKHIEDRPREVKNAFSDHKVARELLNFENKTSLEEGIIKTIKWARELGPQEFKYLDELELDHPTMPKTWKEKLM
jgi:UDP-glucose 4-epimerase